MGIPLAVITNKATRFVRPHLVAAGIERFFSVVIGGDDLPTKKPHPGPLQHVAAVLGIPVRLLLMVGDSGNDVEAARGAGCPVLVVPYGYREGRPVRDLGADGIVPSVDAVADLVRYVVPAARMSLDLFSHQVAAAIARWRRTSPSAGADVPLHRRRASSDAPRSLATAPLPVLKRSAP